MIPLRFAKLIANLLEIPEENRCPNCGGFKKKIFSLEENLKGYKVFLFEEKWYQCLHCEQVFLVDNHENTNRS